MKAQKLISFIIFLFFLPYAFANDRTVNLIVSYKTVNFTGKSVKAIAVNDQIPGPTLHFKKGDHVTINVYNHLDKGTTIHWHGILVPWQMDGVEGVSQKAIPPGGVFHYRYTLYQSGTYWYHAHAGLQEQQGLYGGIIIDPLTPPHYHYTKDYVIVLSDWINKNPEKVYANLKKDGDYYSPRFPLQPSLMHFIRSYRAATSQEQRQQLVAAYKMMQHMRMSIYDLSDIAYDTFLLNGHPPTQPWTALVKVGDIVRLRFIGAGSSTFFHVKIPNTPMEMVQVQGNDVDPYKIEDFTIAPGETYDVLVKIQNPSPLIIYAESADTLGAAYGALTTKLNQSVDYKNVPPFPEPPPVMMGHGRMQMGNMHDGMMMPHMSSMADTKYQNLTAAIKTNNPNKPVHVINMALSGYMGRYIWFINGLPEYKAKPIVIEQGQRYRLIFINNSMMHHPMHIHGHWFILRNGHQDHDPLLHTIDVPPGATVTADFDANASGQWFFHCHNLYHMVAGMAQVFQYSSLLDTPQPDVDPTLISHPMAHPAGLFAASFLDMEEDPYHNSQQITYKGLFGSDYNKLELLSKDAEMDQGSVEYADMDIFYWRLISQFWAIKGGVNYFYRPTRTTPYWQPGIGIEGLMPYFIDTDVRTYYHSGSTKFDIELSRDTQITNNFFIRTGIRGIFASKTVADNEIGSGVNLMRYTVRPYYRWLPNLFVFTEYEHDQNYGVLKTIRNNAGESISEDTVSIGLSLIL